MSLLVELSPQLESRVRERAGDGGDINAIVESLLRIALDAEENDAVSDANLREIEKAIDRADADIAAGHVRPVDEFFASLKAKYNVG